MIEALIAATLLASQQDQRPADCVSSLARAWEVSGEAAADVAAAVAAACDTTFDQAPANSVLGRTDFEQRRRLSEDSRRLIHGAALVLVVRLRACRRTPSCALESIR